MKCPLCGYEKPHKHGKTAKEASVTCVRNVGNHLLTPSIRFMIDDKSEKMCELCCNLMPKAAVYEVLAG